MVENFEINIKSDSFKKLKKSLALCLINSENEIKSFKKVDDTYIFYKDDTGFKVKDLNLDSIYVLLLNYIEVQDTIKNKVYSYIINYNGNTNDIMKVSFYNSTI